jgi:hypothetical protein
MPGLNAPWVKVLGWCELIAGISGFTLLIAGAGVHPASYSRWDLTLAIGFLGTSAAAGFLLLRQKRAGLELSVWIQALQVVGFSAGLRFVAHAGPYITAVVATTGAGLWGGGGGEFIARGAVDGQLNAIGTGFSANVGFFLEPLKTASVTVGINLLAIYFLVQLLRLQKALPRPEVASSSRRRHLTIIPWAIAGATVLLLGTVLFAPTKTLNLPDGRHFDLIEYERNTLALYNPRKRTWEREDRLLVKYYSDYGTTDSMLAEARGLAPRFFGVADSLGLRAVLLNPSRPLLARGFPLVVTSWDAHFVHDGVGGWKEQR